MGNGGKTKAAEQITAARMPQKGTTLRGKDECESRVTGHGLRVKGGGGVTGDGACTK